MINIKESTDYTSLEELIPSHLKITLIDFNAARKFSSPPPASTAATTSYTSHCIMYTA